MPTPASVGPLLRSWPGNADRVYLVGERPGGGAVGLHAWANDVPEGWRPAERGHYLEGDGPTLRYERGDGHRVEVMRAAAYFGEGNYGPADAAAAWAAAGEEIARSFPHGRLLATPATTGRELFQQSIPREVEWPTLSAEDQELIRSGSGQGRIELLARESDTVDSVHVYDGRLFYAALCWGLAAGVPVHDQGDTFLGQRRARYFVRFRVPRDWKSACACKMPGHGAVGLLPMKCADPRDGWRYPAEPGEQGEGWFDGSEIRVALAHGWEITILERLVFPEYSGAGPLDKWARDLVSVRDRLALRTSADALPLGDMLPAGVGQLAQGAIRSIILHTIGAFHGAPHRTTRYAPIDTPEVVPADAGEVRVEGGFLVWAERRPAIWPEMVHPEWSAHVWARARARLLSGPQNTGALHVPAAHVLAFRTDAIYLTAPADWPDDGRPGRFRLTRSVPGPLPTPRTSAELLAMVR